MEIDPSVTFDDTAIAFNYKSNWELKKANFIFTIVNHPFISKISTGLVRVGMSLRLPIQGLVRGSVFEHFCGGETIEKTEKTIHRLDNFNVKTILDYSVEGEKSEAGFDSTAGEILQTLDNASRSTHIPFCVFKMPKAVE